MLLNSRRLGSILRATASLKHLSARFSATPIPHITTNTSESDDVSTTYLYKLRYQKPTTIKWASPLVNNVSLIGHVAMPLRTYPNTASFWVYTVLRVASTQSSLRVLVEMRDDLAKMCNEHLKQDDFIYVSGLLKCYTKKDEECEHAITRYKVKVNELYYVALPNQFKNCSAHEESLPKRADPDLTSFEGLRNSIYLWQVFFSNPWEWWDNRKTKKNMHMPDFKHKDTGECLWIDHRDPPWVKRQLKLLDSKMAGQCHIKQPGSPYRPSLWEYDE